MGSLEVIDVVLSNATGLASLALAYASWRRSRRAGPAVTFMREDGRSVTVIEGTNAEVQAIVDALSADGEPDVVPEAASDD